MFTSIARIFTVLRAFVIGLVNALVATFHDILETVFSINYLFANVVFVVMWGPVTPVAFFTIVCVLLFIGNLAEALGVPNSFNYRVSI